MAVPNSRTFNSIEACNDFNLTSEGSQWVNDMVSDLNKEGWKVLDIGRVFCTPYKDLKT